MPKTSIQVNVYDGTRRLLSPAVDVLWTAINGRQEVVRRWRERASTVRLEDVPAEGTTADNWSVIAAADGYYQSGFFPVRVATERTTAVDLMLLPKTPRFDFSGAPWAAVSRRYPFLASGATDAAARARYEELLRNRPKSAASLWNLITAMAQIHLPVGGPLDYLMELKWDESLAQDRFFAYCSEQLIDQVRMAEEHGLFARETGSGFFHPGATDSWKQVQFGEANVQLTFHAEDRRTVGGKPCITVEPDIDYYKDLGAHGLLEVVPNSLGGGLTDPEAVYALRWIAGRRAGIAEFEPPYVIERA